MSGNKKLMKKKRIKAMLKKRKANKMQASNLQETRIPRPEKTGDDNNGLNFME